jgi:hypothetical protein
MLVVLYVLLGSSWAIGRFVSEGMSFALRERRPRKVYCSCAVWDDSLDEHSVSVVKSPNQSTPALFNVAVLWRLLLSKGSQLGRHPDTSCALRDTQLGYLITQQNQVMPESRNRRHSITL